MSRVVGLTLSAQHAIFVFVSLQCRRVSHLHRRPSLLILIVRKWEWHEERSKDRVLVYESENTVKKLKFHVLAIKFCFYPFRLLLEESAVFVIFSRARDSGSLVFSATHASIICGLRFPSRNTKL